MKRFITAIVLTAVTAGIVRAEAVGVSVRWQFDDLTPYGPPPPPWDTVEYTPARYMFATYGPDRFAEAAAIAGVDLAGITNTAVDLEGRVHTITVVHDTEAYFQDAFRYTVTHGDELICTENIYPEQRGYWKYWQYESHAELFIDNQDGLHMLAYVYTDPVPNRDEDFAFYGYGTIVPEPGGFQLCLVVILAAWYCRRKSRIERK